MAYILIGLSSERLSPSQKVRSENGLQKCRKGPIKMSNMHLVSYKHNGDGVILDIVME
jgi:hypothetical protein